MPNLYVMHILDTCLFSFIRRHLFHRRHWIRRHPEVSATAFCMAVHGSLLTREELKFDQFRENGIHSKWMGVPSLQGSWHVCGKNHYHFVYCQFSWPGMFSTLEFVPDCAEVNHISIPSSSKGRWGGPLGWSVQGDSLAFTTAGLLKSADFPHDAFPTCDAATGAREGEQHDGQVISEMASVTTAL